MTDSTTSGQASKPYDIKPKIFRRFAQVGVFVLVLAATLFLSSGRLDWVMAWVYIGICIVGIAVTAAILITTDPELIAERAQMGKGTKGWDKIISAACALLAWHPAGIWAGHAFRLDGAVAILAQILALAISTLATPLMLGSLWALIPAGISVALLIARTALEDSTCRRSSTATETMPGVCATVCCRASGSRYDARQQSIIQEGQR